MDVYYEIKPGTEAAARIEAYFNRIETDRKKAAKIAKKVGSNEPDKFLQRDGRIIGLSFGDKPEGWRNANARGYHGWYFPKATKENKALIAEISGLIMQSVHTLNDFLFKGHILFVDGLRMIRSAGFETVGGKQGRHFVNFHSQDHADDIKSSKHTDWPKGLVKIRASTVMRLKEDEERKQQNRK